MSLVEQRYNQALDNMSPQARVERTLSLFGSICDMLTLQVAKEMPGLTPRQTRQKVAERLYLNDKQALALLKRVRVD